jgi:predicted nucleic acid-binding Zn ribbon protein
MIGSKPKTGTCQRPGCHQPAKRGRVYCGKACHRADFSVRTTGIPKQPWKVRQTHCVACGATIEKRYPSEIPKTCSKRCMGRWKREQAAEDRLRDLTKKGIQAMTPLEAYTWGYRNGYQRRRMYELSKRTAA